MPSPQSADAAPVQRRPRSRKSIAHVPSQPANVDSENTDPLSLSQPAVGKRAVAGKKSRSKSLGPGGLDALQETSGNRRRSSVVLTAPKSILKPTIPLSPLREIPIHKPQVQDNAPASPTRGPTHSAQSYDQLLEAAIAEDAARTGHVGQQSSEVGVMGPQQPAEDREADERRQRKAEIQKQREARRKSMANRRVSFAPEATLHTWDTEILQESTTSTGSAESTRRASSLSKSQGSAGRPTTPPEQTEDAQVAQSPEHQRDAHQKKRRRSSGIPPMNFNDPEAMSSSPYSGSSAIDEDDTVTSQQSSNTGDAASEDGDGTLGEATMQSLEGDITSTSQKEPEDDDLDASLQDAADRAGTRNIEQDESGEVSMDIVGDDVTNAFKPWLKRGTVAASPHPGKAGPRKSNEDQENINPFSPTSKQIVGSTGSPTPSSVGDDMSMDMTRAMGGIIPVGTKQNEVPKAGRKSSGRRQSVAFRRQSSGALDELGGATMDLTTAFGGVQAQIIPEDPVDENEDLSMEFTSIFGGIKSRNNDATSGRHSIAASVLDQGSSGGSVDADGDMEMTEAFGNIQTPQQPQPKPQAETQEDEGQTMELTTAVGKINSPGRRSSRSKQSESDDGAAFATSGLRRTPVARPPQPILSTSASGSPSVASPAQRGRAQQSSNGIESQMGTPNTRPQTPADQITPQPAKPTTPSKTPPSANVSMRKSSPKKLFQQDIQKSASPAPASTPSLFRTDNINGQHTPSVVLAAPKLGGTRRTSGLGVDKEGLGSPSLAAILDRRASLGDHAQEFAPQGLSRGVRFDDPRQMADELSKEREEDRRRESGRYALEQEADQGSEDDKDATTNLKELMQSMTPKKNKFKGRKSLAVGSAKGLLGKRPVELDEEKDESDGDGSPRTFGPASSPVKKIRLQGPPSASEVTGRRGLSQTSGNARPVTPMTASSPGSSKQASTPKSQGRFKNAEALASAQRSPPVLGQTAPTDAEKEPQTDAEDKIGLQDFLNFTNIRFMELTTTKRRPTMAPSAQQVLDGEDASDMDPRKLFEDSVVAGACTLPMLELFQHSCRELKKYISEGRGVIRQIEAETMDENPPVFREYLSASPADRAVIDNQFKNMKTNARLLSKGMWYDWRMQLLEGIKKSLRDTAKGFAADDTLLTQKEEALRPLFPAVLEEHAALQVELADLQKRAEELAACDPGDLEAARERLQEVTSETTQKANALKDHQTALERLDTESTAAHEAKRAAQAETKEAQRVREDCRGWSLAEVRTIQSRVDSLVASSGWNIVAANGTNLTMVYRSQLQLSFDSSAFLPVASPHASTGLSLAYVGSKTRDAEPDEPSTTFRFFLQLLRAQLHSLPPSSTPASALLKLVSSGWACATCVEKHTEQLRLRVGITHERIVGDERLAIETAILVPDVASKVRVAFELRAVAAGSDVAARVAASAAVVYGEEYREDSMSDFVKKRIRSALEPGREMQWAAAVSELRKGLLRRSQK